MAFEDALGLAGQILALSSLTSVSCERRRGRAFDAAVSVESWPEANADGTIRRRVMCRFERGSDERWLVIWFGPTAWPVQHKRTWRAAEREARQGGRQCNPSQVPTLAKCAQIHVDQETRKKDVAVQLCAYAVQWWGLNLAQLDWDQIRRALGGNEETVADVLLKFVSPEHPASFRSFVSQLNRISRAKQAPKGSGVELEQPDKPRSLKLDACTMSVAQLAAASRKRKEQVYWAIRKNLLPAEKERWGLRVPSDEAHRFIQTAHEERRIEELRNQLADEFGRTPTATRWRILRWKRGGLGPQEIIRRLEAWIAKEKTKRSSSRARQRRADPASKRPVERKRCVTRSYDTKSSV